MKCGKEFKEEVSKLSDKIGLKRAAQQLGILYYSLSDWRYNCNATSNKQKNKRSDNELKKHNPELER